MKTGQKILMAAAAVIMAAVVMILVFCLFRGKYWFRSEPVLNKTEINLERKSLQSREKQNGEFWGNALESNAQKEAYSTLKKYAFYDESETFWVDGADKNDFQMAMTAFLSDYPEVFWLDPSSSYRYYEDDEAIGVELNFTATGDDLEAQRAELEAAVEEAVRNAPDDASDYETELFLNDYLTEHCEYDAQGDNKHSSYGALAEGRAVCDGYSHAFQLLCQRLGIACTVIEGNSEFNEDTEDGHMWNCVQLGGDWYHVDVTWNDSSHSVCGAEHYFYLNLTTEEIARDHQISGGFSHRAENKGNFFNLFVPDCTSDALNYMKLNFAPIDNPDDDEQILAELIAAARNKESFCAYLIPEGADFEAVCDNVINNYGGAWIQGANHYTGGNPEIAEGGKVVAYEEKRVLALQLQYE